jgi:hypothetical protein
VSEAAVDDVLELLSRSALGLGLRARGCDHDGCRVVGMTSLLRASAPPSCSSGPSGNPGCAPESAVCGGQPARQARPRLRPGFAGRRSPTSNGRHVMELGTGRRRCSAAS